MRNCLLLGCIFYRCSQVTCTTKSTSDCEILNYWSHNLDTPHVHILVLASWKPTMQPLSQAGCIALEVMGSQLQTQALRNFCLALLCV